MGEGINPRDTVRCAVSVKMLRTAQGMWCKHVFVELFASESQTLNILSPKSP